MKFEKMVIKHLTPIYPDLSDHLMDIYNNMHDLMITFKNKNYYTKNMHGSYPIKMDYHNLKLIHNVSKAMDAFTNLSSYSKIEREEIRHCLLKYCEFYG